MSLSGGGGAGRSRLLYLEAIRWPNGHRVAAPGSPPFGRGSGAPFARLAATVVCPVLVAGLIACGGSSEEQEGAPAVTDIPPGAVALVGERSIAKRALYRRVADLRKSRGSRAKQTPAALRDQALSLLLYESALEQEAERLGVEVTTAEARSRLALARRPSAGKVRRTAQGERELVLQLRWQLLAEKVRDQARQDGEYRNITRGLQKRWSSRTVCRPGNSVAGCGDRAGSDR